jgi:hypothetical protein
VVAPDWEQRISDAMRLVHDAGLYRPIEPSGAFAPLALRSIETQLEHLLDAVPLDELRPPGDDFDERASVLHLEKLNDSLAALLLDLELARKHPTSLRLIASPTLVHFVVSILADEIARQANDEAGFTSPVSLRPHTDLPTAHRLALEPVEGRPVAPCWRVDIGALLPVPPGQVPIEDLLRFREAHDEERRAMMRAIDDLIMGFAHGQHPEDVFERVRYELVDAATTLRAAARSRKWGGWRKQSIAAIVAGAAFYGQEAVTSTHDAVAAATLALFGSVAVNIATDSTRRDLP